MAAENLRAGQGKRRVVIMAVRPWCLNRKGVLLDDQVVLRVLDVIVGAEAEVGRLMFGHRVNPATLVTVEGPLRVIVSDDVLP